MNRFTQALKMVLHGPPYFDARTRVEIVHVPVIGEAATVKLYRALAPKAFYSSRDVNIPEWSGRIFHSCAQALDECEGAVVERIDAVRVGDSFFHCYGLIEPQPKPDAKNNG